MVKKALGLLTLIGMLSFTFVGPTFATVLTGSITNWQESPSTPYYWGDGVNDLYSFWSTASQSGGNGWFYGSSYSGSSNADVYVYPNLTDPTTVNDASVFLYSTGYVYAEEGDTVFFRGLNGYYGVWRIDDIIPGDPPNVFPYTYLYGQWYFQDDRSANFGNLAPIPEPATMLLIGSGLIGLAGFRKRFKK